MKFLFECWKIFHEWAQRTSEIFFQHLYKHTNELPNHFTFIVFRCERPIYYVAIATVIFSHVKITCYFHMWRYQVFAWKLTWYFIGVDIIIIIIECLDQTDIYILGAVFCLKAQTSPAMGVSMHLQFSPLRWAESWVHCPAGNRAYNVCLIS